MDVKGKMILIITGFLFLVPLAKGIDIDISIAEKIDGDIVIMHSDTGPIQKFYLVWSNTGSVPCLSRARIDVLDGEKRILTLWSPEAKLMPSQEVEWKLYADLPKGNYTIRTRIYHCNEIFPLEEFNITVKKEKKHEEKIEIVDYSVKENILEVFLKSEEDIENVVLLPEEYPPGWIFEESTLEKLPADRVVPVKIRFISGAESSINLTLKAFTLDGRFYGEREMIVEKIHEQETFNPLIFLFVSILIAIFLYHGRKKFLWKKR